MSKELDYIEKNRQFYTIATINIISFSIMIIIKTDNFQYSHNKIDNFPI